MLKIASYLSDCLIVQAYDLEEEKSLPGVLMATEGRVFSILYRLARTDDPAVLAAIRQPSLFTIHFFKQCWGSVTFKCGSGSGSEDPDLWLTDPDPTFMRKGKDQNSDPYLWLVDPDPVGPKICGYGSGSGSLSKIHYSESRPFLLYVFLKFFSTIDKEYYGTFKMIQRMREGDSLSHAGLFRNGILELHF